MEHLTKETFKAKVFDYEKKKEWDFVGDLPCIIDFYADWCGPCQMVSPVLETLSKEYKDKIDIYKIDTDKENELAGAFGINTIPSIMFVPKKGKPQMQGGCFIQASICERDQRIIIKDIL